MTKSRPPRTSAANHAVEWINELTLTGDYDGKPFRLIPIQEDFIRRLFGTLTPDKKRIIRSATYFAPRSSGKTQLAAAIALYFLFNEGPGQQIIIAAATLQQASHVYSMMTAMLRHPSAKWLYNQLGSKPNDNLKRIAYVAKNSFVQCVSPGGSADQSRGFNPSLLIFDELLSQPSRDLWTVLTGSQSKRSQPLTLILTTAGNSRGTLVWDELSYSKKVAADPSLDPTHLPCLYYLPEDSKEPWDSEDTWRKCNPALDHFQNIDDLRTKAVKAKSLPYLERVFRQEHLNQFLDAEDSLGWVRISDWMKCKADQPRLDGITPVGACDLSKYTDLTGFSLIWPLGNDRYWLKAWSWIPDDTLRKHEEQDKVTWGLWKDQAWLNTCPGEVIDPHWIRDEIAKICRQYRPSQVLWDQAGAHYIINDLRDMGIPMFLYPQGAKGMSAPTKEFERLVLSRKMLHDGNPVLAFCIESVRLKVYDTELVLPSKRSSYRGRIDLAVSSIMALAGCMGMNSNIPKPDPIFHNREALMSLLPKKEGTTPEYQEDEKPKKSNPYLALLPSRKSHSLH